MRFHGSFLSSNWLDRLLSSCHYVFMVLPGLISFYRYFLSFTVDRDCTGLHWVSFPASLMPSLEETNAWCYFASLTVSFISLHLHFHDLTGLSGLLGVFIGGSKLNQMRICVFSTTTMRKMYSTYLGETLVNCTQIWYVLKSWKMQKCRVSWENLICKVK